MTSLEDPQPRSLRGWLPRAPKHRRPGGIKASDLEALNTTQAPPVLGSDLAFPSRDIYKSSQSALYGYCAIGYEKSLRDDLNFFRSIFGYE